MMYAQEETALLDEAEASLNSALRESMGDDGSTIEASDDSTIAATKTTEKMPEPLRCCICYGEVFSCCPDCLEALCYEHREDDSLHACFSL